jgi:enoyl-CoA hydratase/carnithine racemase
MNTPTDVAEPSVLIERRGAWGMVTLNRPQAMNALSLEMVRLATDALLAWKDDASVASVLLQGAARQGKPTAFCAGGDIRFFHQAALAGDPRLDDFFTEEYRLDHLIHRYPKPVVALMDGVVMGGGMGLAQGAGLRVVTQQSRLAMPETLIGLFPDVGGGYFLSRCPGRVGEFLALTGQHLNASDAIALGLADVLVLSPDLQAFAQMLLARQTNHVDQLRADTTRFHQAPGPAPLQAHQTQIDWHFSKADVPSILASLQTDGSDWAQETATQLRARSPLMLAVALEQIRRARGMALEDELRMERNMIRHSFALRPGSSSEAAEGVRALVIDKDKLPRWSPPHVDAVTADMVAEYFVSPWPIHSHPLRDFLVR